MVRILAIAVVLAGCVEGPVHGDPGESWTVTIGIDAEAASGWTEAAPGQLFVRTSDFGATSEQLICGSAQTVLIEFGSIGCALEREVEAWIEPAKVLVDADGAAIACGVARHELAEDVERPDDAPFATGLLFEGQEDCDGGEDALELTVSAP